jgi:hypothetical protein
MWSFAVEFLSDLGHVIKYAIITAANPIQAEMAALRDLPADFEYDHVEVTRL